jgi:GNAT superfamily N-acetyltransferase
MFLVVEIREVTPADWEVMREIRLAALREAPYAFGSTYAREASFTQEQWLARLHDRAATYLAYLPGVAEPAGIAGVYIEGDDDAGNRSPGVVSMWVRPAARGQKVGEALVEATADWARQRGFGVLHLGVTETNAAARRLYERCGFTLTGERQPLPSDPALLVIGMRRPLLSGLDGERDSGCCEADLDVHWHHARGGRDLLRGASVAREPRVRPAGHLHPKPVARAEPVRRRAHRHLDRRPARFVALGGVVEPEQAVADIP